MDDHIPADEKNLLKLRGHPVCVVMNDGARYYGLLTGCAKGKVVLNGDIDEEPEADRTQAKPKPAKKRSAGRTRRKAGIRTESDSAGGPPPANPYWGALELEPVSRTKIVLPLDPIEAVLLL
ncbi:hypothetical protein [Cohnella massiliensis]|uniref:hypothetical protein n=1 Tax=Cohnella massiliensis TaxID=1816691 RepID=UPI0009BA0A91|nr:hypothetical protein [Cohnella massiliensis]